jgi:hypothetical protein
MPADVIQAVRCQARAAEQESRPRHAIPPPSAPAPHLAGIDLHHGFTEVPNLHDAPTFDGNEDVEEAPKSDTEKAPAPPECSADGDNPSSRANTADRDVAARLLCFSLLEALGELAGGNAEGAEQMLALANEEAAAAGINTRTALAHYVRVEECIRDLRREVETGYTGLAAWQQWSREVAYRKRWWPQDVWPDDTKFRIRCSADLFLDEDGRVEG